MTNYSNNKHIILRNHKKKYFALVEKPKVYRPLAFNDVIRFSKKKSDRYLFYYSL